MDAVNEIPQRDALRLQLAMIAGSEPPGSVFEIRSKRQTGGMRQTFVPVQDVDRAISATVNSGRLTDTYIGAAPRVKQAGTADAIERIHCVWVDLDTDDAAGRLRRFNPTPSLVIRSGGSKHLHAWWQLRHPVLPAQAVRANRRLALALGADRAATDAARIMRPVGSLNHKTDPPRPVECVHLALDSFTLADVAGGLKDDPAYIAKPRRTPPTRRTDTANALDGLVRIIHEAGPHERNIRLFWSSCRAGEHIEAGRLPAETAAAALHDAALAVGLPEIEIDRTIESGLRTGAAA